MKLFASPTLSGVFLRRMRLRLALIIFAAAILYLIGNGAVALWDRDEPRYAQTSRQMLESGDWIVPRLFDEPREKKPILIYWCQAGSMRLLGKNAFAARFPSVIGVTLTLVVLGGVLWRFIGPRRALWTTFIFATSALTIAAAKMCITDGVLILFVTIVQMCLYAIWRRRGTWLVFTVLGIALGLGILTKGPVVPGILAVTAIALYALLLYSGAPSPPRSPEVPGEGVRGASARWILSIVLVVAVVAPWLIGIERRQPGYTLRTLNSEVIERVKTPQEGHKGPPGYYLLTIWGTYFPWSLLLPGAIIHAWKNRRIPAIRFALAAVVGPWIAFEIVQTKLPHYMLPTFPPLAFLTADMLIRAARRRSGALKSNGFIRIAGAWALVVIAVGAAPWLALLKFELPKISFFAMAVLCIIALMLGYDVFHSFRARRPLAAGVYMGVGMILYVAALYGLYLPNAPFLRISPRVAQVLIDHQATGRGDAIMIDYKEESLAFYQGGTIRRQGDRFLQQNPPHEWPRWIVMTRPIWDESPPQIRERLTVVASVRGWWYVNRMKTVEVLVARKRSGL